MVQEPLLIIYQHQQVVLRLRLLIQVQLQQLGLDQETASSSTFLRGDQTYATAGEDNTPYFSAKGSGTQVASNNVNTTLQFNTLVDSLDSASGYNTGTYEYTVQSGGAGLWYLRAGFYFSGASSFSSGNQVQIQLAKNNADFMSANVFYGGQTDGWVYTHSLAKLAVGNTLKVITYQKYRWYYNHLFK